MGLQNKTISSFFQAKAVAQKWSQEMHIHYENLLWE